jgi:hypothetical protein
MFAIAKPASGAPREWFPRRGLTARLPTLGVESTDRGAKVNVADELDDDVVMSTAYA